jgi:hypothetical protein
MSYSFANRDGTFLNEQGRDPVRWVNAPASGSTVTLTGQHCFIYIGNTGTLAALTIALPPAPVDGQFIDIAFQSAVTALTLTAATGQTITGAPTAGTANGSFTLRYNNQAATWVRWR